MHLSILSLTILATAATSSYVVQDDYSSDSFADMFDFYTDADPTNGYVNYVSYDTAQSEGLYKIQDGAVYMGVDSTNTASGRGRDSVRIASKNTYNHGLVILDLAHMPAGACGTWPAFWMLGPDWPYEGEIDIIEGVNGQASNNMAMHTDAGCTITNTGAFSGSLETANCDVDAAGQSTNAGCSIRSADDSSFGSGFNSVGGGVYATEWTSEAISIWFFPRGSVPSDITAGTPDPSGWGLPQGQFTGGCDIDDKVKDQQLVFDVTFCGDWAGGVWSTDATCSALGSTCQAYVQDNPSAFQDTYWLINSLKVYTDDGSAASNGATASSASSAAAATSSGAAETSAATTFYTSTSSAAAETSYAYTATDSAAATTTTAETSYTSAATSYYTATTEAYTTAYTTATGAATSAAVDSATYEATSAAASAGGGGNGWSTWGSGGGSWGSGSSGGSWSGRGGGHWGR
jgi:hypothetical protein